MKLSYILLILSLSLSAFSSSKVEDRKEGTASASASASASAAEKLPPQEVSDQDIQDFSRILREAQRGNLEARTFTLKKTHLAQALEEQDFDLNNKADLNALLRLNESYTGAAKKKKSIQILLQYWGANIERSKIAHTKDFHFLTHETSQEALVQILKTGELKRFKEHNGPRCCTGCETTMPSLIEALNNVFFNLTMDTSHALDKLDDIAVCNKKTGRRELGVKLYFATEILDDIPFYLNLGWEMGSRNATLYHSTEVNYSLEDWKSSFDEDFEDVDSNACVELTNKQNIGEVVVQGNVDIARYLRGIYVSEERRVALIEQLKLSGIVAINDIPLEHFFNRLDLTKALKIKVK